MCHPKSQRIDMPKKHRMMLHKPYFLIGKVEKRECEGVGMLETREYFLNLHQLSSKDYNLELYA
jgi:hypothetical protein